MATFFRSVTHGLRLLVPQQAYVRDAILIFGICAAVFSYAVATDLVQQIHVLIHHTWGADQIFVVTFVLALAMLVFAYRRIQELAREVHARRRAEAEAHLLARHDPLTGLPNRRCFAEKLEVLLQVNRRIAVLMLDLDGFKSINDVYGHGIGDKVLVEFANRLARLIETRGVIARFGGDEFVILQPDIHSLDEPASLAQGIVETLATPFTVTKSPNTLGVCVGIAVAPEDGTASEDLVRRADLALYRAKSEARCSIRFFEPEMDVYVERRYRLERELRQALSAGEIKVHYQPIVHLDDNRIIGFEALARWTSPTFGPIAPTVFIGIAEETGIIQELSDKLLRIASRDAMQWPEELTLAFNISPTQLRDATLGLRILSILDATGLDPRRLEIEITESALMDTDAAVEELINNLRAAGVRIALDDFGAGYATLSQLLTIRFDRLKIDRQFVQRLNTDPQRAAIVRAIVGLAKGLDLAITAEGIEEIEQVAQLKLYSDFEAQGNLFGKAVPVEEVPVLLNATLHHERRKAWALA